MQRMWPSNVGESPKRHSGNPSILRNAAMIRMGMTQKTQIDVRSSNLNKKMSKRLLQRLKTSFTYSEASDDHAEQGSRLKFAGRRAKIDAVNEVENEKHFKAIINGSTGAIIKVRLGYFIPI